MEISGKPRASQTQELGLERSLRQRYLQGYKNYISQVEQNFVRLTRSNHHAKKKLYSKLSSVFKLAFPGLSLTKWWDDEVGVYANLGASKEMKIEPLMLCFGVLSVEVSREVRIQLMGGVMKLQKNVEIKRLTATRAPNTCVLTTHQLFAGEFPPWQHHCDKLKLGHDQAATIMHFRYAEA